MRGIRIRSRGPRKAATGRRSSIQTARNWQLASQARAPMGALAAGGMLGTRSIFQLGCVLFPDAAVAEEYGGRIQELMRATSPTHDHKGLI